MSGTCPLLLKNAVKDLSIQLEDCSCIYYHQSKHTLYLGMKNGDIYSIKFELYQYKATAHPKLYMSPGFEADNDAVVAMIVAKMPFFEYTVGLSDSGLFGGRTSQCACRWKDQTLGHLRREVCVGFEEEQVQEPVGDHRDGRDQQGKRQVFVRDW